jgi:purine-binding chemotaxis protein CheW
MPRASAGAGSHVILACFELRGRPYAMEVGQIREVVRWQPSTPLPGAPALVEGVIDLRGCMIPVVDLGRALGGAPLEPAGRTRIVVAEAEGLAVGLAVDAALEVRAVEAAAMNDLPALATRTGFELARALVRGAGAPIPLLSIEQCLEAVHRSAPGGTEEAA